MGEKFDRRLVSAAGFLSMLIPVFLVTGRAAADAALSLTAILFLIHCVSMKDWNWVRKPWVRVALILWLWILIVSLWGVVPKRSVTGGLVWIRFILFAVAVEHWIADEKWVKRLIMVSAGTLSFVALDALLQFFSGVDLLGHIKPSYPRLTGPFRKTEVGAFMARFFFPTVIGLFAILSVSNNKQRLVVKVLPWFVGVVALSAIFLSGERAAFFLTCLGLVIALLVITGWKVPLIASSILALVVGFLTITGTSIANRQVESTLNTVDHFYNSVYGQLWRSGLHVASENPLMGVGFQGFRVACHTANMALPEKSVPDRCGLHPHNTYIQWAADTGIPGLILFLLLIGFWVRSFSRSWRSNTFVWGFGPSLGVFLYLWPLSPSGGFFSNWNAVTFWFVLGWGLSSVSAFAKAQKAGEHLNAEEARRQSLT